MLANSANFGWYTTLQLSTSSFCRRLFCRKIEVAAVLWAKIATCQLEAVHLLGRFSAISAVLLRGVGE